MVYTLPGMLTESNRNSSSLPALAPWSIDLYWYDNTASSLTWTAGTSPAPQASFYDWNTGGALTFDMISGTPYPYDNAAVLILQNTSGSDTSASSTNAALAGAHAAAAFPGRETPGRGGKRRGEIAAGGDGGTDAGLHARLPRRDGRGKCATG